MEVAQFFPRVAGGAGRDAALPPGGQLLGPCPRCHLSLLLCRRDGEVPFVMCSGAPACRERVYLPCGTTAAEPAEAICGVCQHGALRKLALTCGQPHRCLYGAISPRQGRRNGNQTCGHVQEHCPVAQRASELVTAPGLQLHTLVCDCMEVGEVFTLEAMGFIQYYSGTHVLLARFRSAALPMGFDAAMTACVMCDQRLKDLMEICGTARPPGQHQHANGGLGRRGGGSRGGFGGNGRIGRGGRGAAAAGAAL